MIGGVALSPWAPFTMQANAQEPPTEDTRVDPFEREVEFIGFLMDQRLFDLANEAKSQLRKDFPNDQDRVEVAEASILLRQGKTEDVEKILESRNLSTDTKAQAILLQLAMTYDAMGRNDDALTNYQKFLQINEGKDITDPDVVRTFAGAGMRLSSILQDQGKFEDAAKTLQLVIDSTDSEVLKRKFQVLAAQNALDFARSSSDKTVKSAQLEKVDKITREMMWGSNDNYFFMAMGIRAWRDHEMGKTSEAVDQLKQLKTEAIRLEKSMEENNLPKSEFPRAALRYVEGNIQFELAKQRLKSGDEAAAKKLAGGAAGNFYNAFLKYEGSEYADRSALKFEELKSWLKDELDVDLNPPKTSGKSTELIFKRQLDLAESLVRDGKTDEAKTQVLAALNKYPSTRYTVGALNTLSRIWLEEDQREELMMLAGYLGERYPDDTDAASILMRIIKRMVDEEDVYGSEVAVLALGRNFPGQPLAPRMMYLIGDNAAKRGDNARSLEIYDELLALYPGTPPAAQVLTLRAVSALREERFADAVSAFEQVRDQSLPGFQQAQARLGIADAKLRSADAELEKEGVAELVQLRADLDPELKDSIYYGPEDKDRSLGLLQRVRFRISQMLLAKAAQQNDPALRKQAADELNGFLKEYPGSDQEPDVMYNLGRLYIQQGQVAEATEVFNDLARKHPESDAGKDALYSLVKAALEEGQVQVAQDAVAKMVQQPDSYEMEKIFQVGVLMLQNERWEEAADSFALVIKDPRSRQNQSLEIRALYSLGKSALGAGRLDEAVKGLKDLIDKYPRSAVVLDAGITLSDVYLDMEPPKLAEAEAALQSANKILVNRPSKVARSKMDLALSRLYAGQGNEKKSLSSLYKVGLQKPESPEHGALVREALLTGVEKAEAMATAGDTKAWGLIADMSNAFLQTFPTDPEAPRMRKMSSLAIQSADDN